ncbi:MAG: hypothetical protein U0670_07190 [Anaerolineae bacterium]
MSKQQSSRYHVGSDGEILPEDEHGKPIFLAGAPAIKMGLFERRKPFVYVALALAFIVFSIGLCSASGMFAVQTGIPSRVPEATMTQSALRQETRAAQGQATRTAEYVRATAILPMCEEIADTEAVVLFTARVNDSILGRVFRASADGSNLCQMPNTAITATFVGLSADGRGAIIQYENFSHHLDFFTGAIQPVIHPPAAPQPIDSQTVFQRGSLTLVSPVSGSMVTIELPPQVIEVLLTQWVVPAQLAP